MIVDPDKFYPAIRATVFRGSLQPSQFAGLQVLIASAPVEWDPHWLADALATAFHETAFTMEPISEYGHGAGHDYGEVDPVTGQRYYGRGYVQLTWKYNYEAMSKIVGADLVANADLALRPDIAATIMFYGMEHGTFTGRKLADFFTPVVSDWINARAIINGHDCAAQIANYAEQFYEALVA
jgi:hypothetical protein